MKMSYLEKGKKLSIISKDKKVQLENILCAVEWIDIRLVEHRFESSAADAIRKETAASSTHMFFSKKDCPEMGWEITEENDNILMCLSVRNTTDEIIRIKKIEPFFIDQSQNGKFEINGSLNQANFLSMQRLGCDIKPEYLWEELYIRETFSSETMMCLYDKSTKSALTAGFITTKDMFGKFVFDFNMSFRRLKTFSAFCDAENVPLATGKKFFSEKLLVNIEDTATVGLENYALRIQKEMGSETILKPPTGWSTWDFYFGDISEENILENVKFLEKHRQEIPVEYIQIDAGYSNQNRDWTIWDKKKFPHGPKWLVEKINKHGFKTGLWLIPFYAREKSRIVVEHPEWLIKDIAGNPVRSLESSFALDGTHPEAQEWLRNLAKTITEDWGFEYIKIDGASMIGMAEGIHYNPEATSCQAYRQGIEAFRKGMKRGTFFIGGIFAPSIGVVDAMRIGGDVGARWDWSKIDVHHGERDSYHGSGYIKRTISSSLNSYYMNGNFWINDGDYLIVRDDRSELSLNEAQVWATVLGLYGGSVILGDRMETLSGARLDILKKIFPVCGISAVPVDFLKKDIPEILYADIVKDYDNWTIAALFNYSENPALKTVNFADIGIDSNTEYHVFGFWKQKYYGYFRKSVSIPLEPHSCEILSIRAVKKVPQIIGTDMHISQGAMEFENIKWQNNQLEITLNPDTNKHGNIFVFMPDGWSILPSGNDKNISIDKNILKLYTNGSNISVHFASLNENLKQKNL